MHRQTTRRIAAKLARVHAGEAHLSKGTVILGDAFQNFAVVVGESTAYRSYIIGKRLSPITLLAKRASKQEIFANEVVSSAKVARVPNAIVKLRY